MAATHLTPRSLLTSQASRGGYMPQMPYSDAWADLAATSTTAMMSGFNNAVNAAYGLEQTGLGIRGGLAGKALDNEASFRQTALTIPSQLAMGKYQADATLAGQQMQAKAQLKAAQAQAKGSAISGLGSLAAGVGMMAFNPMKA